MSRKHFILEKSLELFARNGFNATSIQEITSHCGISKGAFYLSFKSKDELIISLIENFFHEVITGIDRVVTSSESHELPYNYFHYHFENLSKQSDFAKIFIKEQAHFFNHEFFEKIHEYNDLIQKSTLLMLEKAYGEKINHIKFDMIYTVRGLEKAYAELFIFDEMKLDLDQLCRSLTEKTNILANSMEMPFITEDLHQLIKHPHEESFSKEQIIDIIDDAMMGLDSPIEKESLQLLKEELVHPSMKHALITGLISNIKNHPDCKWAAYALENYFAK